MYATFLFIAFVFNTLCFSTETGLQKIDVTQLGYGVLTKGQTIISDIILESVENGKLQLVDLAQDPKKTLIALNSSEFNLLEKTALIDLISLYSNNRKKTISLKFAWSSLLFRFITNKAKTEDLILSMHILKRDIIKELLKSPPLFNIKSEFNIEKSDLLNFCQFRSSINRDFIKLIFMNLTLEEKLNVHTRKFLENFYTLCSALKINKVKFETEELKEKLECDSPESPNKKTKLDTSL